MIHSDFPLIAVTKPWGFEFEFYDNANISAWILVIGREHKSGYLTEANSTSFHMHSKKTTHILCLQGALEIKTQHLRTIIRKGEIQSINPRVFHQISAHLANSIAIEIETPSNRSDIIRLEDQYGRQGTGYSWEKECPTTMFAVQSELRSTNKLKSIEITGDKECPVLRTSGFKIYKSENLMQSLGNLPTKSLIICSQGIISDMSGNYLFQPGDIVSFAHLKELIRLAMTASMPTISALLVELDDDLKQ